MPSLAGTSGSQHCIYCHTCRANTLHEKGLGADSINGLGCLLTCFTCGLALPFWLATWLCLSIWGKLYTCQTCGTKRN